MSFYACAGMLDSVSMACMAASWQPAMGCFGRMAGKFREGSEGPLRDGQ